MEEDDTSPVVDPISRALEISMVKKRVKIGKFLEQYKNNLEAHFSHLHAFACSTGGLLEDGYREKQVFENRIIHFQKILKIQK